jgi:PhnB protein
MNDAPSASPIEVYLTVSGGLQAINFYKAAFNADVVFQHMADDGQRLMHATLKMFGGQIMLSDYFPEYSSDVAPPDKLGGSTVTVHVNLRWPAEVDAALAKAAAAGATITQPAWDAFWGMRYGRLLDPFGHTWAFGAPFDPTSKGPTS